ncbi:hypothetical protein [Caloramator proteoclasticus]|uniref:Uncharacterized protein n=1 Tax=Caloramator proteoclasticus DSM 10124 TaxID=1121262 RepID=A0A1M5BLA0_9CLOT|nr:hypothetical protein [Caloramator proteoclasticus]SHF43259.1 hypothetical protein SAMN02746091_02510 [Caloramator proteoclasticus DSM 10124]
MLDFELDEEDFKIKCYTNVKLIYEKFKHKQLKFVAECKDSDICIVDRNYEFTEEDSKGKLKINVDELSSSVDAFISQDHIEAYLDMIEKYESDDYGVGMADFYDIKSVTKGSLIEYIKINLNSDDKAEDIEKFKKSFKASEFEVGVILFVSIKDLNRLSNFSNVLQSIYPNMDAVIMTPAQNVNYTDKYAEVFVFKK